MMAVGRLKVQVKQKGIRGKDNHQEEEQQRPTASRQLGPQLKLEQMVKLDRNQCCAEHCRHPICQVFLR